MVNILVRSGDPGLQHKDKEMFSCDQVTRSSHRTMQLGLEVVLCNSLIIQIKKLAKETLNNLIKVTELVKE